MLPDTAAFVGTNPENAANFCVARRSAAISEIVRDRLPRRRLLARIHGSPSWYIQSRSDGGSPTAASCGLLNGDFRK